MRKVILAFAIILITLNISSCEKNDVIKIDTEISILGTWKQYSTTNANGAETVLTGRCPNELSIFTKKIVILDYLEVEEPCKDFDSISVIYTISGNMITITDNGVSETAEILTLTKDTLRLKSSSNVINHYTRVIF